MTALSGAPAEAKASAASNMVFSSDLAHGAGEPDGVAILAELALHSGAASPFAIGLLGGPGSGKTSFLDALLRRIDRLAAAARGAKGPFLSRIVQVRIGPADLSGDPSAAIARRIYDVLSGAESSVAGAAEEAALSLGDPHSAAREAGERYDDLRRRLDAEERRLTELTGKRARIIDVLLNDTPDSQVETYARRRRASIEAALRRFGYGGDALASWKSLVAELAETESRLRAVPLFLRSLWSYRGQKKLIVNAVLFAAIGFAIAATPDLAPWLKTQGETASGIADRIAQGRVWFERAGLLFHLLAAAALLSNVWRASNFALPLLKGASLVDAEAGQKRAELDRQIDERTRRLAGLRNEVEQARQQALDAQGRAEASGKAGPGAAPALLSSSAAAEARRYVEALDALREQGRDLPRIIVALDGLETLPADRAAAIMETAHALLSRPLFVTLAALDPDAFSSIEGEEDGGGHVRLERWIQAPWRIDAEPLALAFDALLGHMPGEAQAPAPVEAGQSRLDAPLGEEEKKLLAGLVPLAGDTPRRAKRLLNLYRLARAASPASPALVALLLALDLGGRRNEVPAVAAALIGEAASLDHDVAEAVRAAQRTTGPIAQSDIAAARRAAARFSLS